MYLTQNVTSYLKAVSVGSKILCTLKTNKISTFLKYLDNTKVSFIKKEGNFMRIRV